MKFHFFGLFFLCVKKFPTSLSIQEIIKVLNSYDASNPSAYSPELTKIFKETKALVNSILDNSTLQLLRRASNYTDDDTGNVQLQETDSFHDFYLWGNLANNPRMKTVEFGKPEDVAGHVSINLLKGMHEKNLAIRAIRKTYDSIEAEVEPELGMAKSESKLEDENLTPIPSEADEDEEKEDLNEEVKEAEGGEENGAEGGEARPEGEVAQKNEENATEESTEDQKAEGA